MSLQNTLNEVIKRWELKESAKQMEKIAETPGIKIGFIGKFSSGKTSLINSLLGTHFPVDINPTTKTVCIIEPCNGITNNEYCEEKQGLSRERIDFDRFIALCGGEKSGIVVAKVPPSPILPEGCIFVDTPGIDSLKTEEKDITYSYLAFLDAAVLCVDITEGTLNQDTQDFLLDEKLSLLHDRIIVALTHSDTMSSTEKKDAVISEIITKLKELIAEGKLKATGIEDKVMSVNANDSESCKHMYLNMQKHILGRKEEIYAERRNQAYRQLAKDVLDTLRELKSATYDNKDLENQKKKVNEEITKIEELAEQKKSEIQKLGQELEKAAEQIAGNYAEILKGVPSQETAKIEAISNQMKAELRQACQRKINAFFKDYILPESVIKNLAPAIQDKIRFNENVWEAVNVVVTGVAAAGIGVATGGVGNAVEAVVGGTVAKKGIKEAAKAVALKAGETLVKVAGQEKKEKGFWCKLCETVHEINPITHAQRLAGPHFQEKALYTYIRSQNLSIADAIEQLAGEAYQEKVIGPILAKLEDKRRMLDKLTEEESDKFDSYVEKKEKLGQDIALLEREI